MREEIGGDEGGQAKDEHQAGHSNSLRQDVKLVDLTLCYRPT